MMSAQKARGMRPTFRLGAVTISPELGRIEGPQGPVRLEPKVMDLLVYLVERSGSVVSHADIIEQVWHGTLVTDDVISRAVYQIRRAVSDGARGRSVIETIPKRGYRCLVAPESTTPESSKPVERPRLAVLPFENLSPEPANAFFADGLHEEILGALTMRAAGLELISRTTMMRYRREPPRRIAELVGELGVTHVVEGSVRRDGDDIRLTVQLIDARADRHLWACSYDRRLGTIMTLQSEVATAVAARLSARLIAGPAAALLTTTDPEAYDLYLQAKLARQRLNPSRPLADFLEVERLLCASLLRDPRFALAYLERMRVRAWLVEWNYDCTQARRDAVREDLEAVRAYMPVDDPLILAAQGLYFSEVLYEPQRALALYADAQAQGYSDPAFLQSQARLLLRLGRMDEALQVIRAAALLDPANAVLLNVASLTYLAARRPIEALRLSARAIAAGAVALSRAYAMFALAGDIRPLRAFLQGQPSALDPEYRIHLSFRTLLLERRFVELEMFLASVPEQSLRVGISFIGIMLAGVGRRPVAELRGWAHLLRGEEAAAARAAEQLRKFLRQTERSSPQSWFLGLLEAEAALFAGDQVLAVASAEAGLALAANLHDKIAHTEAAYMAACVFAWTHAQHRSVALLAELAQTTPGLGPGFIARDPICSVPLAAHAQYRSLVRQLEAQMSLCTRELQAAGL